MNLTALNREICVISKNGRKGYRVAVEWKEKGLANSEFRNANVIHCKFTDLFGQHNNKIKIESFFHQKSITLKTGDIRKIAIEEESSLSQYFNTINHGKSKTGKNRDKKATKRKTTEGK